MLSCFFICQVILDCILGIVKEMLQTLEFVDALKSIFFFFYRATNPSGLILQSLFPDGGDR